MSRPTKRIAAETAAGRMHSAAIRLLRRVRQVDRELALSPPRLSALSVLVFGGPMSLRQLAEAEEVKPPAMSAMVKSLEADGYVRTTPSREDRRSIIISPTARGRRTMEQGRRRRIERIVELMKHVSADETAIIARAAEILLRMLAEDA